MICNLVIFFFQAEDGIRDLVRSRGLGDVYKRQDDATKAPFGNGGGKVGDAVADVRPVHPALRIVGAVSYTHLTLPTSDLV